MKNSYTYYFFIILVVLIAVLFTTINGSSESVYRSKSSSIDNISTRELKEIIGAKREDIVLLDVRNTCEYDLGSIEGATLVPLQSIENGEAIDFIREIVIGHKLYIYCKGGSRSLQALRTLKRHNISGINVTGGIDSWASETM